MPFMEKSSINSKRSELGNTDRSRRTGRVLYALTYVQGGEWLPETVSERDTESDISCHVRLCHSADFG